MSDQQKIIGYRGRFGGSGFAAGNEIEGKSIVFTPARLNTLRSPIKPISYGKIAFCDNFMTDSAARFKTRITKSIYPNSMLDSPNLDGIVFRPYYFNTYRQK